MKKEVSRKKETLRDEESKEILVERKDGLYEDEQYIHNSNRTI